MIFRKAAVAAIAVACLSLCGTAAFAQAGGSDVPSDAKKQGTMENGTSSTGMSKGDAKSGMAKDGMTKSEGSMKKSDDKM